MRVIGISDTHMQHEALDIPDGDLLIHCGDGLGRGTSIELARLNNWFGSFPHKYKIYVPGNHDECFEIDPEYAKTTLSSATVLIDELVEIEGFKIYGSPWTPTFMDWNFMKSDAELQEHWDKIPDGLDILITHGPPYGILDWNANRVPCGCQSLYRTVLQRQPRYHIFGHIHQASGELLQNEGINFINAAILDDWYILRNKPKVFEI